MLGHSPIADLPIAAETAVIAVPSTASLALTTFAPTVSTPRLATPPTKALTLTTFAPTVSMPVVCTPSTKTLTVTRFAPTVSAPRLCTPGTKSLTLSSFAPTVAVTTNQVVTPGTRSLIINTFAPTVTGSAPVVTPPPSESASSGGGGGSMYYGFWMGDRFGEPKKPKKKPKKKKPVEFVVSGDALPVPRSVQRPPAIVRMSPVAEKAAKQPEPVLLIELKPDPAIKRRRMEEELVELGLI